MNLLESDYNPTTGITTEYWSHFEDGKKKLTIKRWQDVDPILEQNKKAFNLHSSKGAHNKPEGLGRKVASIPMGVVEKLAKDSGINLLTCDEVQLKRILNDANYNKFRTAPGRI